MDTIYINDGKEINRRMLVFLCNELEVEPRYADEHSFSRRVYKGTDCGAWLQIAGPITIKLGSIVEGCDFDCETQILQWPFGNKVFWDALDKIEMEASYIWDQTHGCDDCNSEGEWGHSAVNPNCKTCKGKGVCI